MVKAAMRRPSFDQRRRKRPDKQLTENEIENSDTPNKNKEVPQKQMEIPTSKTEHYTPKSPKRKEHKKNQEKTAFSDEKLKEKKFIDKGSEKQRVARTVILGGLVSPEMREVVIEQAKGAGAVESIQSSLSVEELKGRALDKDGCKMGAAAITFTSVSAASKVVADLHRRPVGDGIVWARQLGGEGAKTRKWRIIIRNLSFNITEEKIYELFGPYGFVWEAKVPRKEDGQAKGFAFASFLSKAAAEKAIQDMNGKVVQKRLIAVDWAVERKAYQINNKTLLDDDKKDLPSDIEEEETASESEEMESTKKKDSFFKGLEDAENHLAASSDEFDLAKRVLNKVISIPSTSKLENVQLNQIIGDDGPVLTADKSKGGQCETITTDEANMKQSTHESLLATIFIKNLPFDTDKRSLKKLFSKFGKVKSVYLVLNSKTKRPKGTAFLEFFEADGAEAALSAGKTSGDTSDFHAGICFGGRKLEILKAVEKKSAQALGKERSEQVVVDRRNLYLLKEGKIEDGSSAALGVSEHDIQKRRQLEQVKAIKLRSPNFHVSKTRLVVHNIPKSFVESELKDLFLKAVKSRATKQHPTVKELKILRDEAKADKSRGIAFVEFTEHEHALVALRVLNNNPEVFSPDRRPIVEFAIENIQMLRKRKASASNGENVRDNSTEKQSFKKLSKDQQNSKGERKGTELADSEGNVKPKKPRVQVRKLKGRQREANNEKDTSHKSGQEQKVSVYKDTESNITQPAKVAFKGKSKSTSHLNRKRKRHNMIPGEAHDSTLGTRTGSPKMIQEIKTVKKGRNSERDMANFKQVMATGASLAMNHSHGFANGSQKKQKVSLKRKASKTEIADKLDQLVAVYRDKYFSGKGQRSLTNSTQSNEFRRWFE
ncbi:hypothetical protein KP509_10G020200 [Ceratopteris richardii]|nr:hypothetical protein KP509_10G020200 [Ceratopteris richardii]